MSLPRRVKKFWFCLWLVWGLFGATSLYVFDDSVVPGITWLAVAALIAGLGVCLGNLCLWRLKDEASLKNFTTLDLNNTKVTDTGLKELAGNRARRRWPQV
jgi:hypothetical protein